MKVIHRGRRVRHISLKSLLRDSAERNSAAWLIGMRRSFHHYRAEEGGEESTPSSAFSLLLFQHLNEVSSVIILITMWSGMCLVVNWRLARRSLTCHMSLLWRGEEASVYSVTCVFIYTHTHIQMRSVAEGFKLSSAVGSIEVKPDCSNKRVPGLKTGRHKLGLS